MFDIFGHDAEIAKNRRAIIEIAKTLSKVIDRANGNIPANAFVKRIEAIYTPNEETDDNAESKRTP